MSLQVKFPFGRGHAPLHTCGTCGYMTRHRAMFERHMKHCSDKLAPGAAQLSPDHSLPSPPVCRNYRCEKCGFATSKSKMYLQHRRETHGENFSIYPCDQCEYASRHKSKVIRHRSLVHKDIPNDPAFPTELEYTINEEGDPTVNEVDRSMTEEQEMDQSMTEEQAATNGGCVYEAGFPELEEDVEPDENQNTPVKKRRLVEEIYEDVVCSSPEDIESSPTATNIPDPTENAYSYITSNADGLGSPAFTCNLCTYNNIHKWKVATHVRNVHMRKTLFKCPQCDFVTERKIEWCVHKTTHTEKTVHACRECSYRTTMKRNFERHLAHHTVPAPFKCTMCSYSSTGEAAVQRHMAEYHPNPDKQLAIDTIHTTDKPTKTPSTSPLVVGPVFPVAKTKRTPRSRTMARLPGSTRTGHEVQCRLCSVWFKNETRLRIHMVAHSDEAPYMCPLCKLRYKRPADMNRHMKRKHGVKIEDYTKSGETQQEQPDETSLLEQDQPLDLCLKKSDDEVDPDEPLDLSFKSSSSPSPTQVLYRNNEIKCSYCSYMAKWPSDLRRHMLVHSVEKRFRCQVCNKKYKYQFDLNMHLRKSHHLQAGRTRVSSSAAFSKATAPELSVRKRAADPELSERKRAPDPELSERKRAPDPELSERKRAAVRQLRRSETREKNVEAHYSSTGVPDNLKCKHCDYIGEFPAEVERHTQLHTGPQPYLCLFCQYRTFWKGDVKRHLIKHHKKEVDKYGELPELVNLCYKPEAGQAKVDPEMVEPEGSEAEGVEPEGVEPEEAVEDDEVNDSDEDQETARPKSYLYIEMEPYLKDINGQKLFKCPKCSLAYDYPSKLKCHMEIHGDLKRFMCPHCGKRSNWRWDICKHINSSHPTSSPNVVELSEEDAKATLDEYLNSSHTLRQSRRSSQERSVTPETQTRSEISQDPVDDGVYADVGLDDYARVMNPDSVEDIGQSEKPVYKKPHSLLDSIPGGMSSLSYPEAKSSSLITTVASGRYRRFKCSVCGKRSNWKWDIRKHIRGNHASADIIEMTEQEARATFHEVLQAKAPKEDVYKFPEDGDAQEQQAVKPKWRPFKCPKCSKRSNWKWDLKKHMLGCAPGTQMIILSDAEAKATFVTECGHYVERKLESQAEVSKIGSSHAAEYQATFMPKVKKFKCSLCPYRSDYRSDISRHLKRKHHKVKGKILVLGSEYAAATLPNYKHTWARKKFVITPEKVENLQAQGNNEDLENCIRVVDPDEQDRPRTSTTSVARATRNLFSDIGKEIVFTRTTPSRSPNNVWQCSMCDFKNGNKMIVIDHFKSHGKGRAFRCKACLYTSDYRGSMYRHVKSIHHRKDYQNVITYCALMSVDSNTPAAEVKEPEKRLVRKPTSSSSKQPDPGAPLYTVKMFQCQLCPSKTVHKHNLVRHIKEKHSHITDPHGMVQEVSGLTNKPPTSSRAKNMQHKAANKSLACELCPFRTSKQGLLTIHEQYHKQQGAGQLKCKFCPYYISTTRRLLQHMKLHEEEPGKSREPSPHSSVEASPHNMEPSPYGITSSADASSPRSGGKARHFCDKCPYVSINKNDFIYHKQFHRPKAAAQFKCDYCPYWVSLQRLLTQHKKVHSPEYKLQYYPRGLLLAEGLNTSYPLGSPTKSIESEMSQLESESMVNVAYIKQQIISSKVVSVPITPGKLQKPSLLDGADDRIMTGYIVDPVGRVITNKSYQRMHTCRYCPYTNIRYANLRLHEKMHGRVRVNKDLHQCKYCDYQVGNKGLLAHHRKVHSAQYEPGQDDINDVEMIRENEEFNCETEEYLGEDMETVKKKNTEDNNNNNDDDDDDSDDGGVMKFVERDAVGIDPALQLDTEQLPHQSEYYFKMDERVGGPVLEKATQQKWCCEQCPYATLKRIQFEKHILLHGSKQKYPCEYCDYSVPGYHLLLQHKKLHLMPNPNLLSVQSISNLQLLPEVPADFAVTVRTNQPEFLVHDNMDFYENSPDFVEPKKLFRCDRCPYTNSRRDHLLSHLKFHVVRSDLQCPYCDYSVTKVHLLNQHIRVHFSVPGSEMSAEPKPKSNGLLSDDLEQPDFFTALKLKQKVKPKPAEEQATDLSMKTETTRKHRINHDPNYHLSNEEGAAHDEDYATPADDEDYAMPADDEDHAMPADDEDHATPAVDSGEERVLKTERPLGQVEAEAGSNHVADATGSERSQEV